MVFVEEKPFLFTGAHIDYVTYINFTALQGTNPFALPASPLPATTGKEVLRG